MKIDHENNNTIFYRASTEYLLEDFRLSKTEFL